MEFQFGTNAVGLRISFPNTYQKKYSLGHQSPFKGYDTLLEIMDVEVLTRTDVLDNVLYKLDFECWAKFYKI